MSKYTGRAGDLMRSGAGSLEGITEKMNSSKFIKSGKILNESFKNMMSAIPGMGALSGVLTQFLDASGVLKPFEAVFQVILGIFGIMGAQVIPVLMEAIIPLIQLLMQMTPIWIFLGQIMAVLIQIALIPLTIWIEILTEVMVPLIPVFEELTPVIKELSPVIKLLVIVLKPLLVPLVMLVPLIQMLGPAMLLVTGPFGILLFTMYALREPVNAVGSAFGAASSAVQGLTDGIQSLINTANAFNPWSTDDGGGDDDDDDDDWWPFW